MQPDTAPTLPAPPPFLEHSTPEVSIKLAGNAVILSLPTGQRRVHQWRTEHAARMHADCLAEVLGDLGYVVHQLLPTRLWPHTPSPRGSSDGALSIGV